MIAVDTNILVYAVMQDDPHHMSSRRFVETVAKGLVSACVFPQNLPEFYSVVTNPRRVSSPLSVTDALREVSNLRNVFHLVNPQESSLDRLLELVAESGTTQSDVFDAFIVSQMCDAGIEVICTYNGQDFSCFPVQVLTPDELLGNLGIQEDWPPLVHDQSESSQEA